MIDTSKWQLPDYQVYEFRKKNTKYCVCIPVLNEGEKLKKQIERMLPFSKMVDIIIADWGSTDGSINKDFLRKYNIRALFILRDKGWQSTQLRMAFSYALTQDYEGIIQMDGNNKDGEEGITRFIKAFEDGFDYIHGSRFIKGGNAVNTPLIRWLGIRLIFSPLLSLASGFWFTDVTNGFRAYSRKYLLDSRVKPFRKLFNKYELLFYLPVRAGQIGMKMKEIPVTRKYPYNQKTPTKIVGIYGHGSLLMTAIQVALGTYNPI